MAAFGAAIADEGRPQQQRARFLQVAEGAAMGRASRLYLAGNGSRILTDAPCDGLEGHPAAQASLNFNSILQCHVLVPLFRHVRAFLSFCIVWDLLSHIKYCHIFASQSKRHFKCHCCIYFGNSLLAKKCFKIYYKPIDICLKIG